MNLSEENFLQMQGEIKYVFINKEAKEKGYYAPLNKVICLLENHKTDDFELKAQIKKAIFLIHQGVDLEESYRDYMASEKEPSLKKDKRWQTLAEKDIPF